MNKTEQEQAQAFQKGVEAMRKHLAVNFDTYAKSLSRFSGPEIAAIVRRVEGPKFRDASLPTAIAT